MELLRIKWSKSLGSLRVTDPKNQNHLGSFGVISDNGIDPGCEESHQNWDENCNTKCLVTEQQIISDISVILMKYLTFDFWVFCYGFHEFIDDASKSNHYAIDHKDTFILQVLTIPTFELWTWNTF